jgi:hypothetical protein
MDPHINHSSDISVLFTTNLSLSEDTQIIEQKLRKYGITNIEQVLNLTMSDLLVIGIKDTDAEILLNRAKYV